jgi:DNA-binding MarR family transcriptional regulator
VTGVDDSSVVKGGRTKVLKAVSEGSEKTGKEVLSKVPFSQNYVSETLQRLEDEGLVESRRSSQDKRNKIYKLTEQGREFLKVVNGIYSGA